MRPAPAARFMLPPHPAPRVATGVVAATAAGGVAAWAMAWGEVDGAVAGAFAAAVLVFMGVWRTWRRELRSLRWDGVAWHLGAVVPPAKERAGELTVALDLGPCLLLRFRPALPARRRAALWIYAQREGPAAPWLALRRAVYSPRPAAVPEASAGEAGLRTPE